MLYMQLKVAARSAVNIAPVLAATEDCVPFIAGDNPFVTKAKN